MEAKTYKSVLWKRWDIMVATFAINGLIFSVCLLIIHLYDQILPDRDIHGLWWFSAVAAGLFLTGLAFLYARTEILSWLKLKCLRQTGIATYKKIVLSKSHKFDIFSLVGYSREIRNFLNHSEFLVLLNLPFIFVFGIIIGLVSPLCLIPPIGGAVLSGLIAWIQIRKTQLIFTSYSQLHQDQTDLLTQIAKNYFTLKALGMESLLLRRFEKLQYEKTSLENILMCKDAQVRDLATLIFYSAIISCLLLGSYEIFLERTSFGGMAVCVFLTAIILYPPKIILGDLLRFRRFNQANRNINLCLEDSELQGTSELRGHEFRGRIHLENIEFEYEQSQPILSNLNLLIQPNSIVSIFGANGVGKTTLAHLITGQLPLQNGKITFDGFDVREISKDSLAQQVLYVSSVTPLFKGTLMDNLTMFRGGPLEEEAVKLSQDLGLSHWIDKQPLAYQTPISDDQFFSIPAGIRQRIGLTRAILSEPKILILDEVNATIDEEGDTQLKKILLALKEAATIILITHRPSMKQIADDSYDLVNGALVPSLNVDSKYSIRRVGAKLASRKQS